MSTKELAKAAAIKIANRLLHGQVVNVRDAIDQMAEVIEREFTPAEAAGVHDMNGKGETP